MSEFTPGPWFAGWGDGITGPKTAAMIEWTGKYPVHRITTGLFGQEIREPVCALHSSDADHQANARLISAAPDLLEAARIALLNYERSGIAGNADGIALRAAIAKATGPQDEIVTEPSAAEAERMGVRL